MSLTVPSKISIPFAESGSRNVINANLEAGDASNKATYTYGFPQITMTPKASGGLPPFGRDMNGILYSVTAMLQYMQAGGTYPYDAAFATAIGGYNQGALVQQADLSGLWVSTVDNNTSNPETSGSGWMPLDSGSYSFNVTTANVTLTNGQAAHPVLIIGGTLTGSRIIFVPTFRQIWTIINNTSRGSYTLTIKTANGTGITLTNSVEQIVCDGTNIYRVTAEQATTVPIGGLVWHFGQTIPSGYLLANGQAVSRTLYSALFGVLGTKYGSGDGSTTFNLPNLMSRFIRGGTVSQLGTTASDSIRSHGHGVTQSAHTHGLSDPGHSHSASTSSAGSHTHTINQNGQHTHDEYVRDGGGGGGGNRASQMDNRNNGWISGTISSAGQHNHTMASAGSHTHPVTIDSAHSGISCGGATANITIQNYGASETAPAHIYGLPILRAV